MRWKKHGKIFDPTEHRLANDCHEFAQSPQALVCEDCIRVYFSTRAVDKLNGKFLSHISFVDFARDLTGIRRVSAHTILPLGGLGCFDEHGIFPMNVLPVGDMLYGYTCGWSRRVSVSVDTAIGLAVSRDGGETFQRLGPGPVLAPSKNEPFLIGDGFAKIIGSTFHMWYIFGVRWSHFSAQGPAERIYKIGHATSSDGIHWTKEEGRRIISDRLGEDECQALPTVVEIAGRYHMFFCYRQAVDFRTNPARGYRIGHAWSDDLSHWNRDDNEFALEGDFGQWDGDMQCYPHAFSCDGKIYLLYNGNEFGRFGFGLAELSQ